MSSDEIINRPPAFFNNLPQAKFKKTMKVKCAEEVKLCLANVGKYFEIVEPRELMVN